MARIGTLLLTVAAFAVALIDVCGAAEKNPSEYECWTAPHTISGQKYELRYLFAPGNMYAQMLTGNGKDSVTFGRYVKDDTSLTVWLSDGSSESGTTKKTDREIRYKITEHSTDKDQIGDVTIFSIRVLTKDEAAALGKVLDSKKWLGNWYSEKSSMRYTVLIDQKCELVPDAAVTIKKGTWSANGNDIVLKITFDQRDIGGGVETLPTKFSYRVVKGLPCLVSPTDQFYFIGYE